VPRHYWHQLPPGARAAVEAHAGPVAQAMPVVHGSVSDVAAILHTSRGEVFCKGVTGSNPLAWMHRREATLNPHMPACAPRLRWQVETDGWLLLGFDPAPGRHVDLAPGSPDLPRLAATLTTMAGTPAPVASVPVQPASARWAQWIEPEPLAGDTLVHSDVTPKNFLIKDGSVAVVDWSMPCRGAPWIDTALMVIRLVRAGHTPAEAEQWASLVPAWRDAHPERVTTFAAGWAQQARDQARGSPAAHLIDLAEAATRWARQRNQWISTLRPSG
jgi:hypothetical protein